MNEESKYINEAREFAKNNPDVGILDYLKNNDNYRKLSKFCRIHYLRCISKFFANCDEDEIVLWGLLNND